MESANFTIRLPYYQSIPVGTLADPEGSSLQRDLRPKTQYVFYSTPVSDPVEIWGINFTPETPLHNIKIQLTNTADKGIWTPLLSTPMTAIGGIFTQADPILELSQPYELPPGQRLQLFLQKIGADQIDNTILTLCGVRLVSAETFPCFN